LPIVRPIALYPSALELYLWDRYDNVAATFVGEVETIERRGAPARRRNRSYWCAWKSKSSCGGPNDLYRWVGQDDGLTPLRALGFEDIGAARDEPEHENRPSFSIFARGAPGRRNIARP
jgi:hypothetical protein